MSEFPCEYCGTPVHLAGIYPDEVGGLRHDDHRCMSLMKSQLAAVTRDRDEAVKALEDYSRSQVYGALARETLASIRGREGKKDDTPRHCNDSWHGCCLRQRNECICVCSGCVRVRADAIIKHIDSQPAPAPERTCTPGERYPVGAGEWSAINPNCPKDGGK